MEKIAQKRVNVNGRDPNAGIARDVMGRHVQRILQKIKGRDEEGAAEYDRELAPIRRDILRTLKMEDFPAVAWLRMRSPKVDGDLKGLHDGEPSPFVLAAPLTG